MVKRLTMILCVGKGGGVGNQWAIILAVQISTQDLNGILMPLMNLLTNTFLYNEKRIGF